jgi:hypothetical protein
MVLIWGKIEEESNGLTAQHFVVGLVLKKARELAKQIRPFFEEFIVDMVIKSIPGFVSFLTS